MSSLRMAARSLVTGMEVIRQMKEFQKKAFSGKYLLVTNVALSLGLSSFGDILEQQYERYTTRKEGKCQDWDLIRTRNMGLAGSSVGVICHYWYKYLDRYVPGRTMGVVMKKIVLDQLICSPVYITAFFVTLGLLENQSAQEMWKDLKSKAVRLYMAEWMVWPVAQFVNFYWLPSKYRVFYDNLISLGYDVYTSRIKHEAEDEEDDTHH